MLSNRTSRSIGDSIAISRPPPRSARRWPGRPERRRRGPASDGPGTAALPLPTGRRELIVEAPGEGGQLVDAACRDRATACAAGRSAERRRRRRSGSPNDGLAAAVRATAAARSATRDSGVGTEKPERQVQAVEANPANAAPGRLAGADQLDEVGHRGPGGILEGNGDEEAGLLGQAGPGPAACSDSQVARSRPGRPALGPRRASRRRRPPCPRASCTC